MFDNKKSHFLKNSLLADKLSLLRVLKRWVATEFSTESYRLLKDNVNDVVNMVLEQSRVSF